MSSVIAMAECIIFTTIPDLIGMYTSFLLNFQMGTQNGHFYIWSTCTGSTRPLYVAFCCLYFETFQLCKLLSRIFAVLRFLKWSGLVLLLMDAPLDCLFARQNPTSSSHKQYHITSEIVCFLTNLFSLKISKTSIFRLKNLSVRLWNELSSLFSNLSTAIKLIFSIVDVPIIYGSSLEIKGRLGQMLRDHEH